MTSWKGLREQKIDAIVRGLVAGDNLSWMGDAHRVHLLPERRARMLHDMAIFSESRMSTTRPVPHAHSSPTDALRPGPADDVEWFAVSTESMLDALAGLDPLDRWRRLAGEADSIRARSGTHYALANLRRGLVPPQSGNDNAHYFDDIACVRAVAMALFAHDADSAAQLAARDAHVTHALDGVWCASAVGVLVHQLAEGAKLADAIRRATKELPEGSWSRRAVDRAMGIAASAAGPLDLAYDLRNTLTDRIYTYSVAAPETVAILFAHASISRTAEQLMMGALANPRNTDALPALAGAVAGAAFGSEWMPRALRTGPIEIDGVCIPELAGTTVDALIDRVIDATRESPRPHA